MFARNLSMQFRRAVHIRPGSNLVRFFLMQQIDRTEQSSKQQLVDA